MYTALGEHLLGYVYQDTRLIFFTYIFRGFPNSQNLVTILEDIACTMYSGII